MPTETQKILERLNRHPEMLPRLRAILDIMDDAGGDLKKAAEEADSDSSLRRMGLKKQSGTAPTG